LAFAVVFLVVIPQRSGGPAVAPAFAFAFWPLPLFFWLSFRSAAEDLLLLLFFAVAVASR